MKQSIALLSVLLSLSVATPATIDAEEVICYVCGDGGGGVEVLAGFDGGGDEGQECTQVVGNGGGYRKCKKIFQDDRVQCWLDDTTACGGGGSLALETSVDGYLKVVEIPLEKLVSLQEQGESRRRPCDGVVIARVLSTTEAAAVSLQTRTISL